MTLYFNYSILKKIKYIKNIYVNYMLIYYKNEAYQDSILLTNL